MTSLAKIPLFFLLFILPFLSFSQLLHDPNALLRDGQPAPTQVLMVGTFHFAYYGADAHVTQEEDQVNVLLPQRQREMQELVRYIAQFNPTKIAVEAVPGGRYLNRHMADYQTYLQDSTSLKAREVHQIAFRLRKQFRLDTLYGVDAWTLMGDLYSNEDSIVMTPLLDSIYKDWDFSNPNDPYDARYDKLYDAGDQLAMENSLLDYFLHMNDQRSIDAGWGAYLVGDFKNGHFDGADALAMHFYDRNLRIMRNIQSISAPGDRVLVLIGAGHLCILNHLMHCSPEFDLIPFGSLGNSLATEP
ncbi:MAG: DUF5694 domain-containing protein [Salibacteraceae bacterium]